MWEIKFKFHAKTQMIDSSVDSNILLWYPYSVNMRRIFISAKSMFCEEPLDDFKDYILSISGLTSLMYLLGMSCIAHTRIQRPQPSLVAEASPKWSHSPGLTSLNRKTPLSRGFMLGGGEWGIRTPEPVTVNGFQDRRIRPLCQLSATKVQIKRYPPRKNSKNNE